MPIVAIIVLEAFLDPIAGILVREQGSIGTSMKGLVWMKALEENQETGSERPHGDNLNRLRVNLDPEGDFMVLAKTVLQSPQHQTRHPRTSGSKCTCFESHLKASPEL